MTSLSRPDFQRAMGHPLAAPVSLFSEPSVTRPQVDVVLCRISTGSAHMRTDRRTFLKNVADAAGLVFVGCGVTGAGAQSAQRAAVTRRPVVVKGRRITTVD